MSDSAIAHAPDTLAGLLTDPARPVAVSEGTTGVDLDQVHKLRAMTPLERLLWLEELLDATEELRDSRGD